MSQPKLNHAMVLNTYLQKFLDELDLCAVATEFVGSNEQRQCLFGSITKENFHLLKHIDKII